MAEKQDKLFTEFSASTYDEWYEATVKSLKGKPFDKLVKTSYEGFDIQPMYRAEDIANLPHVDTLPGHFPYVRGTKVDGYQSQPWLVSQKMNINDPAVLNATLKRGLERGQTAIYIGQYNHVFHTREQLKQAFAGIDLEKYPIFIDAPVDAMEKLSLVLVHSNNDRLHGCVGYDPLHHLAKAGNLSLATFDWMSDLVDWSQLNAPDLGTIAVSTEAYHNAGANAVQEIAVAIATGVEYIQQMLDRGHAIDDIAGHMWFFLNIGENFFAEIAKLRTIKMIWAQIVREYGGNETSQKIKLHVDSGLRNKTEYDTYVNMLRTTTEAMAGALGGIDSMSVTHFDVHYGDPDEFSERIARNIHLILQEEVNLTNLIDPAGGSWYVEHLTNQLAQSAWKLFQEIEAQGGMLTALREGFIQKAIQAVSEKRLSNISQRSDILVGTNMYVNLDENTPDYRVDTSSFLNPPQYKNVVEAISNSTGAERVNAVIDASRRNISKFDIASSLLPDDAQMVEAPKLNFVYLASQFEILRYNAKNYQQQYDKRPQIFLANFGTLRDYKARMDFTRGFYEVGGFDLIDNGGFDSIESAVQATVDSDAPAVVICSTDDKYAEVVPAFVPALKAQNPDIIVILAGYPQDKVDDYRKAGVDDFIHIRANCYDMNKALQDKLGVSS